MEGSWDIPNMDWGPGKSKWFIKGKPEETPHISDSNCHEGTTQGLSLSLRMCLSTHTILFFSINTLLASLLSIFVEILFCKVKGPGPLSLTVVLWLGSGVFTTVTQPQSPSGNPSPTPSCCRPRLPKIISTTNWKYSEKNSRKFQKAKLEFALPWQLFM